MVLDDVDGYLLYDNRDLVQIECSDHTFAKLIMRPCKLKSIPYTPFLPVGFYAEGGYHGPCDYYEVVGKDSIKFLGRGYWGDDGTVIASPSSESPESTEE